MTTPKIQILIETSSAQYLHNHFRGIIMLDRIVDLIDLPQKKAARVAGVLYLLLIITGIFAQVTRMSMYEEGDATKTAENIMDAEMLFRLAIVSDFVMILSYLILPLVFYILLKPVNKNLASLVVVFVMVSVPIMFVNMILHTAPLIILNGDDYLKAFTPGQREGMALMFFELYWAGVKIATLFHGLWLFPLGLLVHRSGYFPKILGIFLILACFGFVIETLQYFLLPDFEAITYPGMLFEIIGEFGFCGWLLVKGADLPK